MTSRSTVLKRFGVAAVAVATIGTGLPLLASTAATAQTASPSNCPSSSTTASPSASATSTATMSPSPSASATASASPSASATASMSPSATATASASPCPTGSASPTGTASPGTGTGGTATPTGTRSPGSTTSPGGGNQPSTPPGCIRAAEVMLRNSAINATGRAPVSVTASPNSFVQLFAYTRPSTQFRVVRSGTTDSAGNITFADLRPPANTRLRAQQRGCAFGRDKVLNVRTQLSLNVVRNGTRNYTFSGRAIPARNGGLIVSLYRVTNDGRQILTSQARANASTGQYVINRRFTGSGRFGFVVRTGQDLQNAPGTSNVRSLLVF